MVSIFQQKPSVSQVQNSNMLKLVGVAVLAMATVVLTVSHARAADKLAPEDKSFLTNAAEAGNAEINASQLALQKSSDPEIKNFAQRMFKDHSQVGEDLKKLATAKGVTVPDDPAMAAKAKILLLSKLDGHNFDKQYAGMIGVSAHKDAVTLFKKAAASAKDPDIKQFATINLPTLQQHLEMAQELKTSVDAEK
ncbi:MAG: DUF4142 domain-containing protein [Collimonas pratensis]|uniref:DUF4142 domain-containing protein n=1 Tax=Collimonas pratensis TaxID=279113 RepID=UPI003C731DA9